MSDPKSEPQKPGKVPDGHARFVTTRQMPANERSASGRSGRRSRRRPSTRRPRSRSTGAVRRALARAAPCSCREVLKPGAAAGDNAVPGGSHGTPAPHRPTRPSSQPEHAADRLPHRSRVLYVGHPTDAINIEWNIAPDFEVNPHCRTGAAHGRPQGPADHPDLPQRQALGRRRARAGEARLHQRRQRARGLRGRVDAEHHRGILGGWRKHGLPWRQV